MGATQSGPVETVKSFTRMFAAAAVLSFAGMLAGCAGSGWVNPDKTAAEAKADEATCNREAEEDTLAHAGRPRPDYAAPGGPGPGSYGQSPMEMHDRDVERKDFRGDFARCMESKGYTEAKQAR